MYNKDKQLEFQFNTFGLWIKQSEEWVYQRSLEDALTTSDIRALNRKGKLEYLEYDDTNTWTFDSESLAAHFLSVFTRRESWPPGNVVVKEFVAG
jgi:hypothetical protein